LKRERNDVINENIGMPEIFKETDKPDGLITHQRDCNEQGESLWSKETCDGALLANIERCVEWIRKSSCIGVERLTQFRLPRYRYAHSSIKSCLEGLLVYGDLLRNPDIGYSVRATVFLKACVDCDLIGRTYLEPHQYYADGALAADLYNQLIERIRQDTRTTEFQKKLYREKERYTRNLKHYTAYTDHLFDAVRSRLIVVRLDLKYRDDLPQPTSLEQAQADIQHLLENRRGNKRLFNDLEGYIWKLEYGYHGMYHFHVILFFNNDHYLNDSHLGERIGRYWVETVTQGRGSYFNCNRPSYKARFESSKRLGIGRIEAGDLEKRNKLKAVVAYLCKSEQQINTVGKAKFRTMARGEMVVAGEVKLGRPRKLKFWNDRPDVSVLDFKNPA